MPEKDAYRDALKWTWVALIVTLLEIGAIAPIRIPTPIGAILGIAAVVLVGIASSRTARALYRR